VTGKRPDFQLSRKSLLTFPIVALTLVFAVPALFGVHLEAATLNSATAHQLPSMANAVQIMVELLALGLALGRAVAPMEFAVLPQGVVWVVRWSLAVAKANHMSRILATFFDN
jgi:hypothetical protein